MRILAITSLGLRLQSVFHIGLVGVSLFAPVPLVVAQDSKSPRMDPRLSAIIQGIRDGEQLFRDFDMEYEETVTLHLPPEKIPKAVGLIENEHLEAHVVVQGDFFYLKESRQGHSAKGDYDDTGTYGFGGDLLRAVRWENRDDQGYANLISGPLPTLVKDVSQAVTPYGLVCRLSGTTLSGYLEGTGIKERHQLTLAGEEVINQIPCVKLIYVVENPNANIKGRKASSSRTVLWLASDRHFQPVRFDFYLNETKDHPDPIEEAQDWREVEPGIMMPFRAVKVNYGKNKQGQVVAEQTTVTEVKKISLRPHYDREFFRDVTIPKGCFVYVQDGDKIIRSYIAEEQDPPPSWLKTRWLTLLTGLTLILLGVLFAYLRRKKRLHGSQQGSLTPLPANRTEKS